MTDSRIDDVLAFFARWDKGWDEFVQSHFDFFTEDCVWENQGFPSSRGPQQAYDMVQNPCRELFGMSGIRVDVRTIAEADGRVWSERVDHLLRADGSVVMSLPVTGIMEFDERGRLAWWREYFDPGPITALAAEAAAGTDA